MKFLLSMLCIVVASLSWAADPSGGTPPMVTTIKGEVLEVKDVDSYTYLRLKTRDGEIWAAVTRAPVKAGATVTLENASAMSNFESRALKRTFPTIYFGMLAGGEGNGGAMAAHGSVPKATEAPDIKVPKAKGANAKTVAEIVSQAKALKDKPVLVSGKVVKYNAGIMGRNWVHLRDGTGSASDGSNDVLVTTAGEAKVGDVVTAKGVVRADKDFGSGYFYKVIVEDATFQ